MERLRPPRGLIVDLITPLTSGGDIDGRGLGRLLDRLLPHVQALLLASPYAGEGLNLAPGQRAELLDKALVVVRGSVPVLVWISGDTEERTAENLRLLRKTKEARRYTGPIIWVDTPLLYHSNRGLSPLYERLVSEAGEPFVLHNDPEMIDPLKRAFKRRNIRTSILKELVLTEEGIQGLIFSGSLDRAQNYQKALRSRTGFNIYDGDESNFLVHPSLSGVISKGANLAPRAWQKITASSLRQDDHQDDYPDSLKQIWELGGYLNGLKTIYDESTVLILKLALSDMGVIESPASTIHLEIPEDRRTALKELMEKYGDFR
ncbi:MAG: dihydrodipicolinate synthase family protein [Deltaproteobacteria bacterium]|nr:dihydrodipicolinate synthase family protein [Deltaproteobacteria bacterium]